MKKTIFLFLLILSLVATSQNLTGAWENVQKDTTGRDVRNILIFTDKYQSSAWYDANTGAFIATNGGLYKLEDQKITETIEFDSQDPNRVGQSISFAIKIDNDELKSSFGGVWKRGDSGEPGDLVGAWLISGRMQNGEIRERATDRPRKTMKILSGTRFQWIAYNTETKQFMGTGGGTYTTEGGKYTENIEFFSRDDSRVGASLAFDYEIKDGKWHHSGSNSRDEPMYEIWAKREK